MRLDDLAVLDRECIERSRQLVARDEQRRGRAFAPPSRHVGGARGQILGGQRRHDREAGLRSSSSAAIGDKRLEPPAEDPREIAEDRGEHAAMRGFHGQ